MPLGQHNKDAQNELRVPSRGIVGWRALGPILKVICKKLCIKFSVEGMDIQEIDGGVHFRAVSNGAGGVDFPFRVSLGTDEEGLFAIIAHGTVHGQTPTIGGVPLDAIDAPKLRLTGAGVERIYLEITVTRVVSAAGYLLGYTDLAVTVQVGAAVPADDLTGTYRRHIASVGGGRVTGQPVQNSFDLVTRDTGLGAGEGTQVAQLSG
jgi:hypothetical protein